MLNCTRLPLVFIAFAWFGCTTDGSNSNQSFTPQTDTSDLCATPLAPREPLCSNAFSDAIWSTSHRSSYAQGSSPLAGPTAASEVTAEHIDLPGGPIIVSFSAPYDDGGYAAWATVLGVDAAVIKVDHDTFEVIDTYVPAEREDNPPAIPVNVSGAYAAVDAANRFIVGRTRFVSFFRDSVAGDRSSPIELERRVFMPEEVFCSDDDIIAGMTLTFDGQLAFATELGNLFVIAADVDPDDLGPIPVVSTNPDCANANPASREVVSNSIAADENGGIYLVTSAAMYRFDWDGTSLRQAWRAEYETVPQPSPIRLGPGSGSTPSLMGTRADDDRFVAITDGQELMHLVLFWRDAVPDGWEPIAPGKDPRIACEIPIRFGTNADKTSSEQSIAVRGHSALLVNNLLTNPTIVDPAASLPIEQNLVSAIEGGVIGKSPFGLERVDWDPTTRSCSSIWANSEVSVPNGIPSISEASQLVYGIGFREGQWGLEGLDFETGASRVWAPAGPGACDPALLGAAALIPSVAAALEAASGSCENSSYAATTVGPDGVVYTGTFFGMSRYVPSGVQALSLDAQMAAGLDQSLDLLQRAEAGTAAGAISVRDNLRRALVQLDAVQSVAAEAGDEAVRSNAEDARRSIDQAVIALDDGGSIEDGVDSARSSIAAAAEAL